MLLYPQIELNTTRRIEHGDITGCKSGSVTQMKVLVLELLSSFGRTNPSAIAPITSSFQEYSASGLPQAKKQAEGQLTCMGLLSGSHVLQLAIERYIASFATDGALKRWHTIRVRLVLRLVGIKYGCPLGNYIARLVATVLIGCSVSAIRFNGGLILDALRCPAMRMLVYS